MKAKGTRKTRVELSLTGWDVLMMAATFNYATEGMRLLPDDSEPELRRWIIDTRAAITSAQDNATEVHNDGDDD